MGTPSKLLRSREGYGPPFLIQKASIDVTQTGSLS